MEAVKYIRDHREQFVSYMDEDIFKYLNVMSMSGTWGGHYEMKALGELLNFNINVYELRSNTLEPSLLEFDSPKGQSSENKKVIHLSFHMGMHYNSVRKIN